MEDQQDGALRERLAHLEAENAVLRAQVRTAPPVPPPGDPRQRRGRGPWWTVLATVLIVIGCLLAPIAVITGWAKATLTDTDTFVATYAPLAHDPNVQAYVSDQVTGVINQNVDVSQITSDLIDGVKALGTGPRATAALDALKGPATQGIQTLIHNGVTAFVGSDAFAQAWEASLRISHTQLIATMSNDPNALIAAQGNGTIGIQLGPIVDQVKAALLARGITFASRIPAVNKTIAIAQSNQVPTIQGAYRLVVALGTWLVWVSLIFLAAGVLVARRRALALVWAAAGLGLSMLLLLVVFRVGLAVVLSSVPASVVPSNVTTLLFGTATAAMRDTAIAGFVLGLAVAVVAWFAGPFGTARRLRAVYSDSVGGVRRNVEGHGVTTGRVGEWVYAQRRVLHVIIALAAAAAIILLRPLSVADIVWTLVIAVVVLIVVSLVERPEAIAPIRPPGEPVPIEG